MNVLLLSAGTRNKVVQYFKENTNGRVVVTDMQSIAPAIYEADRYYIVPHISAPDYIGIVLDICKKESIQAVASLIDPELSLLAKNKERFSSVGVTVIGSSYELCEMALNKMQMYHWLRAHGYRCARSYENKDDFYREMAQGVISFPVIVKPICGSASKCVHVVEDQAALEFILAHSGKMIIQEYLKGQEIGADCYIDMISGETVSIFTKKKLLMRAGETDKSVSFKDPALFSLIERFAEECGWRGQIDIDIFDVNGEYYISEVNPRFGGGYPHAHACGCNHIKLIENNINGLANEKNIGDYEEGVYMMKYNEIMVKKIDV